jgi:tetratricopeptide (TPR) repeat protein
MTVDGELDVHAEAFRQLLTRIIGERSQAEFAAEIMYSRTALNAVLSGKPPSDGLIAALITRAPEEWHQQIRAAYRPIEKTKRSRKSARAMGHRWEVASVVAVDEALRRDGVERALSLAHEALAQASAVRERIQLCERVADLSRRVAAEKAELTEPSPWASSSFKDDFDDPWGRRRAREAQAASAARARALVDAVKSYCEMLRLSLSGSEADEDVRLALREVADDVTMGFQHGGVAEVLAEAVEVVPDDPALWFSRGLVEWGRGSWAAAVTSFTSALDLGAPRGQVLWARGQARAEAHQLEAALADLDEIVVPLDEWTYQDARAARAYVWAQKGWREAAEKEIRLIDYSSRAWIQYMRGLIFEISENLPEMRRSFDEAFEKGREFPFYAVLPIFYDSEEEAQEGSRDLARRSAMLDQVHSWKRKTEHDGWVIYLAKQKWEEENGKA